MFFLRMKLNVSGLKGRFTNTFLPSFCYLCSASCDEHLCPLCQESLPVNSGQRCCRCDLPLETKAAECAVCLTTKRNFDQNISAFRYQFPIDGLILKLKNNHEHLWAHTLAEVLLRRVQTLYGRDLPNVITSVPLHWTKQIKRGYNQSDLISRYLCRALKVRHEQLLKKTRTSRPQQGLNKAQRAQNLRNSFAYSSTQLFQHVALVDDVLTTGSTADAAAKVLKKAGVQKVDIWTLARTPEPDI